MEILRRLLQLLPLLILLLITQIKTAPAPAYQIKIDYSNTFVYTNAEPTVAYADQQQRRVQLVNCALVYSVGLVVMANAQGNVNGIGREFPRCQLLLRWDGMIMIEIQEEPLYNTSTQYVIEPAYEFVMGYSLFGIDLNSGQVYFTTYTNNQAEVKRWEMLLNLYSGIQNNNI